jgi:1,2-diacylglycerol 3-beta-galactosyltransferase
MMHAADCVMCKAGGLIVTEALACGLPLLLIDVLPGQEAGNADSVVQGGAGELAQDPLAALEILYHWLAKDAVLLTERAENARRLGRARAAYEIAAHAWAAAERGPGPVSRRLARARPKLVELLGHHDME